MFSLKHAAQCRDLSDISRQRCQLVGERSRTRNRVKKVVGRSGLRLGGILTDVFGVNGRKVLKGVLEARPREFILESLTPHVRHKYDLFADALQAQLSEDMRFTLERLLQHHDHLNQMIVRFTRRLSKRLQPYSEQLELLCTIPGICPDSAMTLLVEIGPESQVFANARSFGAWSGTGAGQQRKWRQTAQRSNPTWQSAPDGQPGRVRACRRTHQRLSVSGVSQSADGPTWLSPSHRRHRTQTGSHHLRGAARPTALP